MRIEDAIRGFYAVLDRDDETLARTLLSAGAKVLQVRLKPRDKRVGAAELLRVARMARRVCTEHGAALVVNDRLDVALIAKADGVHLGQTDLTIEKARVVLAAAKRSLWIGVSTHDLVQVQTAVAAGADYLGYGPVFDTTTKANPDTTQGLDALRAAVIAAGNTPVVAIGGITPARARDVYATGVAGVCAISSVNMADVTAAARALGHEAS